MFLVYSKPDCSYCDKAELLLSMGERSYTKIDLTKDQDAMDFIVSKGLRGVPQIFEKQGDALIMVGGYRELEKYLQGV